MDLSGLIKKNKLLIAIVVIAFSMVIVMAFLLLSSRRPEAPTPAPRAPEVYQVGASEAVFEFNPSSANYPGSLLPLAQNDVATVDILLDPQVGTDPGAVTALEFTIQYDPAMIDIVDPATGNPAPTNNAMTLRQGPGEVFNGLNPFAGRNTYDATTGEIYLSVITTSGSGYSGPKAPAATFGIKFKAASGSTRLIFNEVFQGDNFSDYMHALLENFEDILSDSMNDQDTSQLIVGVAGSSTPTSFPTSTPPPVVPTSTPTTPVSTATPIPTTPPGATNTPTSPVQPTTPPGEPTPVEACTIEFTTQATATPSYYIECVELAVYNDQWIRLYDLSTLQVGDTIYLVVTGATNHPLGIESARFRITITPPGTPSGWLTPTGRVTSPPLPPGITGDFYLEYTIPATGSYRIEAQVCNSVLGCA